MSSRHKLRTLTRSHILVLAGAVVAALFLVGSVLWAQSAQKQAVDQTGVVEQQRDGAAAQAASLAEQIKTACTDGTLTGPVCEQAKQVAATPAPTNPPPPPATGEPGRPPTTAEIQAAVDAYLVAYPPPAGRAPNAVEVAAAVASYLTANPPTPGRAPTAEEISAAVAQYFADNPPPAGKPGEDGKDGGTGQPGRPPTVAEIDAAVAAWIAAHPDAVQGPKGDVGPAGPPGEIGCPAGTSLQDVEFASGETGLGCVDDEQSPPETTDPIVTTTTQVPGDNPNTDGDSPPASP